MKMQLTSGAITPINLAVVKGQVAQKYGIENIKKILLAIEHIKTTFEQLQAKKENATTLFQKIVAYIGRIFGSYSGIEQVVLDITQIVQNRQQILAEIKDLDAIELSELSIYLANIFGYTVADAQDKIKNILPAWLQGWAAFLE